MKATYHFGKNWSEYLARTDAKGAAGISAEFLKRFLGSDLEGKTFIDAGSGSGVHSLAALTLGASRVVAFDADPDSVACTQALKKESGYEKQWAVTEGSLLDESFMKNLGQFDVVYSWGVAHHTGDMWKALENLMLLTKPGGLLWVAIYNKVEGRFGSSYWRSVKKMYNTMPRILQKILEWKYIAFHFLLLILHAKNPLSVMREYPKKRGMSWATDLTDWLGGYPYEYASVAEIFSFFKKRGYELVNIQTTNYRGCNQFLFRAP